MADAGASKLTTMDSFEVSVDGELFRISERCDPGETLTYDFSWLNGPANGTYGFSLGAALSANDPAETESSSAFTFSKKQLIAEVQGFVTSFYSEGGIGQEDFPDHVAARKR